MRHGDLTRRNAADAITERGESATFFIGLIGWFRGGALKEEHPPAVHFSEVPSHPGRLIWVISGAPNNIKSDPCSSEMLGTLKRNVEPLETGLSMRAVDHVLDHLNGIYQIRRVRRGRRGPSLLSHMLDGAALNAMNVIAGTSWTTIHLDELSPENGTVPKRQI